jgi:hypothetical protein
VMGWRRYIEKGVPEIHSDWLTETGAFRRVDELPKYCTTPAQALEVQRKINPNREIVTTQNLKGRWFVTVHDLATGEEWSSEGDTLEMCLCEVALKVVGV